MTQRNRGNRDRRNDRTRSRPKMLYSRATAVVINENRVLLVKHNRENEWALPGGQIMAGEDPAQRAVIEVAEETGIHIAQPQFVGRYAGSVASHQIYIAQASGEPRPNTREIQDARWWDGVAPLRVQQHVNAILAIVRNSVPMDQPAGQSFDIADSQTAQLPAHIVPRLPDAGS